MGRKRSAEKKSNLRPVYYFGLLLLFIIVISFVFKTFDTFKKSKFDGDNRFTIAIKNNKKIDLLTVSPKDKTISKLEIKNISEEQFKNSFLPHDASVEKLDNADGVKPIFSSLLNKYRNIDTDLTIIDVLRLKMYSNDIESENIKESSVINLEDEELDKILQTYFIDPKIVDEKKTIQITNSSNIAGLGNTLAKYLTSIGANVVLVNTSQSEELESKIYYNGESYTLDKLSKILDIEPEEKNVNSISDITIIIGKDKEMLFEK